MKIEIASRLKNRVTDCINSPCFWGVSGGMLPQKILKLKSPNNNNNNNANIYTG